MEIRKISTISTNEYIQIIGTYKYLTDKKFNCYSCKDQFSGREDREVQLNAIREFKGCWGLSNRPSFVYMRAIKFFKCPANFYNGEIERIIIAYQKNKDSMTRDYADLPNKLAQMYDIIDNLITQSTSKDANGK